MPAGINRRLDNNLQCQMTVSDECNGHCFPLDDSLIQHGVDHLHEPGDVGPHYIVAGMAVFGGGIQAGGMDPIIGNIGP
jgi:hypothetical protein